MKLLLTHMSCALVLSSSSLALADSNAAFEINGEAGAGLIFNSALSVEELDDVSSESDNGYEYQVGIGGKWHISDKAKLSSSYAFNQKTYNEYSQYDLALHQLGIDGSYKFDKSEVGLRVDGASASLAGETFLNYQQASVYYGHFLQPQTYLRSSVKVKNKSFADLPERDASGYGGSVDLFHFLNDAKTMLMLGLSGEKEQAEDNQFDYVGQGIQAKISHKFNVFGLISKVGLGWRFQQKDYQSVEVQTLATEEMTQRDENRQVLQANWELQLLDSLSLKTELEHGDYKSQLEGQTYQQSMASLGLHYKF